MNQPLQPDDEDLNQAGDLEKIADYALGLGEVSPEMTRSREVILGSVETSMNASMMAQLESGVLNPLRKSVNAFRMKNRDNPAIQDSFGFLLSDFDSATTPEKKLQVLKNAESLYSGVTEEGPLLDAKNLIHANILPAVRRLEQFRATGEVMVSKSMHQINEEVAKLSPDQQQATLDWMRTNFVDDLRTPFIVPHKNSGWIQAGLALKLGADPRANLMSTRKFTHPSPERMVNIPPINAYILEEMARVEEWQAGINYLTRRGKSMDLGRRVFMRQALQQPIGQAPGSSLNVHIDMVKQGPDQGKIFIMTGDPYNLGTIRKGATGKVVPDESAAIELFATLLAMQGRDRSVIVTKQQVSTLNLYYPGVFNYNGRELFLKGGSAKEAIAAELRDEMGGKLLEMERASTAEQAEGASS